MGCNCGKPRSLTKAATSAELNDGRTYTVEVPGGKTETFTNYDQARRFARRVGSVVAQA